MIIISPYAKPAFTDSSVASYQSLLDSSSARFGLAPMATYDANAYAYSDSFDFSQAPRPPIQLTSRTIPRSEARWLATHPVDPTDPT